MKKLSLLFAAASLLALSVFAQTQHTSRTNTRTHDRTEVTKEGQPTDQDKNNPDKQTKTNAEKNSTRDSLAKAKQK